MCITSYAHVVQGRRPVIKLKAVKPPLAEAPLFQQLCTYLWHLIPPGRSSSNLSLVGTHSHPLPHSGLSFLLHHAVALDLEEMKFS